MVLTKMNKKTLWITSFCITILMMGVYVNAATTINTDSITTSKLYINSIFGSKINYSTPDTSLKIYANEHQFYGNENGESIQLYGLKPYSKAFIGWQTYDLASNSYMGTGWLGCHYESTTTGFNHSHCSWETLDNNSGSPVLNTKFEIKYGSNLTQSDAGLYAQFSGLNRVNFGTNVDVYLKSGADIKSEAGVINLYGDSAQSVALAITTTSGNATISSSGSNWLRTNDNSLISGQQIVTGNLTASNLKATNLTGIGSAYACIDSDGNLFRSATPCV
jgi:hypothetical protein